VDLRERTDNERRHPWEVARARFFRGLVADHVDLGAVRRVLDVGAGDGWFAHELAGDLAPAAQITCWDVNYRSEDLATPTDARIVRTADAPGGEFDLITVLDVLEHIDDAEGFLAGDVVPRAAPGATVVLSVPAHPALFSAHDRMLEHHRRYQPAEFVALVGRHLQVVAHGPLFTSLLLPRAVSVGLERLGRRRPSTGVGAWRGGPGLSRTTTAALGADAAAGRWLSDRGLRLPGLSAWAVATAGGAS
jgi:hypothetical protein